MILVLVLPLLFRPFRIATSGKMEEFDIDDDFDNDWSYECEKKGKQLQYLSQCVSCIYSARIEN